MTNKKMDKMFLKRKRIKHASISFSMFLLSVAFFVLGGVYNLTIFYIVGGVAFIACTLVFVLIGKKIRVLKEHIEKYCPKCNMPSLFCERTSKEDAGTLKTGFYSRGMMPFGKVKLIRETKYYRCSNCRYETYLESTSAE